MPADPSSYYRAPWQPSRLHRNGAARGAARSSGPSTAGSIAARGWSASGCRSSCSRSASRARQRCRRRTCRPRSTRTPRPRSRPTSPRRPRAACPGTRGSDERRRLVPRAAAAVRDHGAHASRSAPTCPAAGRIRMVNLLASKAGLSQKTIVVLAHRDDSGAGPGANDNASGTAALIELARAYSPSAEHGARPPAVQPRSSSRRTARSTAASGPPGSPRTRRRRRDVIAVVNLDSIAGPKPPRLELNADTPALADARPRRDRARAARGRDRRHRPAARRARCGSSSTSASRSASTSRRRS